MARQPLCLFLLLLPLAACSQAPSAPIADTGLAGWRQAVLEGCIGGGRDRVSDPTVPVERHCTCAVDRLMAGKTLAELQADEQSGVHAQRFQAAMRQCIAEISPNYRAGLSG